MFWLNESKETRVWVKNQFWQSFHLRDISESTLLWSCIVESLYRPAPRPKKLPALSEEKLQSALITKWNSNEIEIKLKLKFYIICFFKRKKKILLALAFNFFFLFAIFHFAHIPLLTSPLVRLLYVEVLFVANLPALVMLHRGIWTFQWPLVLN